jgi:hypothetical protein
MFHVKGEEELELKLSRALKQPLYGIGRPPLCATDIQSKGVESELSCLDDIYPRLVRFHSTNLGLH